MTWRGELAGYTGTLILEEVDEDEHVARYRFQGTRDGATATAVITLTAGELRAEVHAGYGSDLTADSLVAAVGEGLANGSIEGNAPEPAGGGEIAVGGEAPAGGDRRPTQPAVTAGPGSSPGRATRGRGALVAAGAAAALAAWALKGRR